MQNAVVTPKHGTAPIGGTVDGTDQMAAHRDNANILPYNARVVITTRKEAVVTTYGGHHSGDTVFVVSIQGKNGWYMAGEFGTA